MLPIVPVSIPAVLAGQSNGRLPLSILVSTPGQAGGATVRLVEPAARAWRALTAEALARGHVLKPTSLFDSYRPLEIQTSIFIRRYTTENLPGQPSKLCGGVRYWILPDMAPAACPGFSNHGWGLAVDVGEERDGDTGVEAIDPATVDWLANNELRFGFSHEIQIEKWHIRYWAGDNIPAAVLAYEEDQMATAEEIATAVWTRDVESDTAVEPAWKVLDKAGEDVAAALAGVNELKVQVAAILDALGNPTPAPPAAHTHELGPAIPE